ncbi:MAG: atypical dual specificity phosphatase [Mariniblastus sp.]|jgi:atypical dual specificity phosphatase
MQRLNWLKARIVFYPTLFWNMLLGRWLNVRNWWDRVDDHIVLGAFPFAADVSKMAGEGVKGVVNTCEEYPGPVEQYEKHGIEQMRMPTIDFTHPSFEDVCKAVEFIDRHVAAGDSVYIHCKAGRARSATVAICWLMKTKQIRAVEAQAWLSKKRPHINQHLPQRPVVQRFEQEFVKP